MKISDNEEIIEQPKAEIITEDLGDIIEVKIIKQTEKKIREYKFTSDSGIVVHIGSIDETEYRPKDSNGRIFFFLKGSSDYRRASTSVMIPKDEWKIVKEALLEFGAIVDSESKIETKPEVKEISKINYDTSSLTPTEDEIEEMINLVNIDTFNKIIKNRLIQELPNSRKSELEKINRKWAKSYLRNWAISKYKFYKIFGNKLSVNKKIEIEPSSDEIEIALVEIKKQFPLYAPTINNMSTHAFLSKTINTSNVTRVFFEDKRVKSGMSTTKFISLFGNKDLDIAISKMYQDTGKNTIYLSINPIDYLTVSINASGWESCHHFLKGCYRNAGLSYMFDKTSLISFASKNVVPYAFHFPYNWNTKNWRQMVYMSENNSSIVFSRQYPYDSSDMTKTVREVFEKLVSDYFNSINSWKVYSNVDNAGVDVRSDEHSLAYNDVTNGFGHTVVKAKDDEEYDNNSESEIIIGARVPFLFNENSTITGCEDYLLDRHDDEEEEDD